MKLLKNIVVAVLLLVVALAIFAFFLPRHYKVERSIDIGAAPERVFPLISDPREWKQWSAWNARDPNMQIEYSGPASGVGAKWSWKSAQEGSGSMEFTRADAPSLLEYSLYFPDFDNTVTGKLALSPVTIGTRVTWSFEGDAGNNPIMRYFGVMMDRMVGADFETGLKNLKAVAEK